MKWEKTTLEPLIEIKKGSYITKKESNAGPYPVILGGQEPAYFVDKYNHTGKAIVISRSGASAGFVSRWDEPIFVTDGFLIEAKERIDFDFLFYLLKHHQPQLQGLQDGAAIPHVNPRIINAIEVLLPSLPIQRFIVNVLSVYDCLIDNNQKQIKLLEEAAQRLYKEWFIDLRFPGHETTPIVNGIPEGWTKTNIDSLCELLKIAIVPDKIESNIPYIGLEHMPRKDFCLSTWDDSSSISSNKYCFKRRNILFGKIRPYFHKVGFAITDGVTSTDSFVIEPKQEIWGLFLLTVSSDAFVNYAYKTCKEGAKMPRADWNQMKEYSLLVANESVQKQFEKIISEITKQIEVLAIQNHKLIEARDRLLPKLMSGEIEV